MTDGSLDDRCDAKAVAVAMRSLSPARCLARFLSFVVVPPAGGGASMDGVPTRHVVLRRVLVR